MRTPRAAALALLVAVACPRVALCDTPGRQLAGACAACHGPGGSTTGIPPLVGADEASIVRSMLAFRTGERRGQIMHVIATTLSPQEITAVAHYLAAQRSADAQR